QKMNWTCNSNCRFPLEIDPVLSRALERPNRGESKLPMGAAAFTWLNRLATITSNLSAYCGFHSPPKTSDFFGAFPFACDEEMSTASPSSKVLLNRMLTLKRAGETPK